MLKKIFNFILKLQNIKTAGQKLSGGKIYKIFLIYSSLKEKRRLLPFIAINSISLILVVTCLIVFNSNSKKSTELAIQNGQMALVNLESDTIIVGRTISDTKKKEAIAQEFNKSQEKITNPELAKDEANTHAFKAPELPVEDSKKNKIAIIVKDLGLSKSMTLEALQLPQTFTLGFSPYANNVNEWIDQAAKKGFETLINIPLQPTDYPVNDPGPRAMLQNLSTGENLSRLDWILSRSNKILGVYSLDNETFSTSRANISPVLESLQKKDKILIYGNMTNDRSLENLSASIGTSYAAVNVNIDDELDEEKIKNNLLKLEGISISNSVAIGYINPYPITIKAVNKWLSELDNNSVIIAPLSSLIIRNNNTAPISGNFTNDLDSTNSNIEKNEIPKIKTEEETSAGTHITN